MADSANEIQNEQAEASLVSVAPVTFPTLLKFLVGNRAAILSLLHCPQAIWLGALLVLSAGFAREYDAEYLLAEPWHLLIPHVASFLTCAILFGMVSAMCNSVNLTAEPLPNEKSVFPRFVEFLSLYWMTAPLAWLYAIPFERWLSPGDATRGNLYLPGIVSVWRVALIILVIRVIWGATPTRTIVTVLLFGDAIMLLAIWLIPVPILQIMGGIQLTEQESILLGTTLMLRVIGYPALVILFLWWCVQATMKCHAWNPPARVSETTTHRGAWIVAGLAIAIGYAVLPLTQSEQRLRWQAEQFLEGGDIEAGLAFLSEHELSEFPPHWVPPPHLGLPNPKPSIHKIMMAVSASDSENWVTDYYLEQFVRYLDFELSPYGLEDFEDSRNLDVLNALPLKRLTQEDRERIRDVLQQKRDYLEGNHSERPNTADFIQKMDECIERLEL